MNMQYIVAPSYTIRAGHGIVYVYLCTLWMASILPSNVQQRIKYKFWSLMVYGVRCVCRAVLCSAVSSRAVQYVAMFCAIL